MKRTLRAIVELIQKGQSFLITSHVDPDGDSVASQLALAAILAKAGKLVKIVNQDSIPKAYTFLSNSDAILPSRPEDFDFFAVFTLDSPNLERLGTSLSDLERNKPFINIDHHVSNQKFGDYNLVVPEASSTSELVYELAQALGIELDSEIATGLLTGICADTGGLKQPNTSARTLRIVSELMQKGAGLSAVMNRLYEDNTPSRMRLLGSVLSSLRLLDGILILSLTRDMLRETGSNLEESDNFADYALSVRGVKVGMLLREKENGVVRVSLRSREPIDVDRIASEFGGGGHPQAAGCQMEGGMDEVRQKLVAAVRRAID